MTADRRKFDFHEELSMRLDAAEKIDRLGRLFTRLSFNQQFGDEGFPYLRFEMLWAHLMDSVAAFSAALRNQHRDAFVFDDVRDISVPC